MGDPRGKPFGDLALRQSRPVLDAGRVDDMHDIGVAAEYAGSGRDVVGDDPVAAFARQFLARPRDQILGLGGEPDNEARPAIAGGALS